MVVVSVGTDAPNESAKPARQCGVAPLWDGAARDSVGRRAEKHSRHPTVSQLPDCPVQHEVMEVHDRKEKYCNSAAEGHDPAEQAWHEEKCRKDRERAARHQDAG